MERHQARILNKDLYAMLVADFLRQEVERIDGKTNEDDLKIERRSM
jgi:hypothetical protein